MSSSPVPSRVDLTGLEGDYVVRGWTRSRIAGLIAELLIAALVLVMALLLHERWFLIWAFVLLLLIPVAVWRVRRSVVTTTISSDGITIDQGSGPRGRTHITWDETREVYVAGAWQAHSSVRTRANQEIPLPGVDRARARELAEALRAAR